MRDFQAVTNKHFVRNLSAKIQDATRVKAENGWYPGNHPPLGYVNQHVVDAEGRVAKRGTTIGLSSNEKSRRQVIREYELRAEGLSYQQIRQQIVREGFILPSKLTRYRATAVEQRLKSPFYRGSFRWQEMEYKGKHELFIPKKLLAAVDATLGKIHRPNDYGSRQEGGVFANGWFTCARDACGCAVIYDPRKGTARTHHYYRCTNSKKIHTSMRGMNVREENIWMQYEQVVESIDIDQSLADQIMEALNAAHQKLRESKKREIKEFSDALKRLEDREDELYSGRRANLMDDSQYARRLKKIRDERAQFTQLLEDANSALDGAYLETAKSILKLATDTKRLWNSRNAEEKRDFLKRVLSNSQLDGLTVRYELRKPSVTISKMRQKSDWCVRLESNQRPLPSEGNTLSN